MRLRILSWILNRKRTSIDIYLYNLIEEMIKMGKADEYPLFIIKKFNDKIYNQINDIIVPILSLKDLKIPIGLFKTITDNKLNVFHLPSHRPDQILHFY
jgi:hypothetical protein